MLFRSRDPDGDALGSAQWQISQDNGFSQLVLDRRLSGATGLRIPLGILQGDRDYWVRTRHYDATGLPSEWSADRAIRTEARFAEDSDGNGIDDRYQVSGYADSNRNGTDDADEGLCNLRDAENGNTIGFQSSTGTLRCLTSRAAADLPAVIRSGKSLPYGLFTLVIDGLPADAAAKYPSELSGGMRKRVGLARALVMQPEVLLYDEPTTGLDPIVSDVINELMIRTRDNYSGTSIIVTHDMKTARKVADRVVMLYPLTRLNANEPQIIFDGTPKEIDASVDRRVSQFVRGEAGDRLTEMELSREP